MGINVCTYFGPDQNLTINQNGDNTRWIFT